MPPEKFIGLFGGKTKNHSASSSFERVHPRLSVENPSENTLSN